MRRSRSRVQRVVVLLAGIIIAFPSAASSAPAPVRLREPPLEAFSLYVRLTEARVENELRTGTNILWVDALPEARREAAYAALRRGEVEISRLHTLDDGRPIRCPDGLIHHWVGVVFIPGATLDQTLHVVQDYDHHSQYYRPEVLRSKILRHEGNDFEVELRLRRKKVITVVLDTRHEVRYLRLDAQRAASRSRSTRIAEVKDAGSSSERVLPPGEGGGYLWRMNTYWRFLERDGGTYVQCESVSLTRDIPTGLGWLIGPFVESIPRESLVFTLTATRTELERQARPGAGEAR